MCGPTSYKINIPDEWRCERKNITWRWPRVVFTISSSDKYVIIIAVGNFKFYIFFIAMKKKIGLLLCAPKYNAISGQNNQSSNIYNWYKLNQIYVCRSRKK